MMTGGCFEAEGNAAEPDGPAFRYFFAALFTAAIAFRERG